MATSYAAVAAYVYAADAYAYVAACAEAAAYANADYAAKFTS
jgi:hypothetical protein